MIPARVEKLRRLAVRPGLWRTALSGVVPALEHWPAFEGWRFDTVVDAGAHRGQFATFALTRWPAARVICFEPLPKPRARLKRTLAGLAAPHRWEIRAEALGARSGAAHMHVASREDSSSMLPLGPEQKRLFSMDETGREPVTVARLDEALADLQLGRALLKIDVQGFELEVLKGAGALLERFEAVYVECSFRELYVGQSLEGAVTAFLAETGFNPENERRNFVVFGDVVQVDKLYRR